MLFRSKDKTNREGLISLDEGEDDFIGVVQTILSYVRKHPYEIYRNNLQSKKAQEIFKTEQIQQDFDSLKKYVRKVLRFFQKNASEVLSLCASYEGMLLSALTKPL